MSLTRRTFIACACCAATPLAATAAATPGDGTPQLLELGTPKMTRLSPTVWVARIAPDAWLHTTTGPVDGLYYPANGLILDRADNAILIDTAWNPAQANTLLQWCAARGRPITQAIATHFHGDRTGGIPALQKLGIPTQAHPLTCDLAGTHAMPQPTPIPNFTTGAHALTAGVELFHPGPGHTRDNILTWLPNQRVLYGGCFLKSATTNDLGYTTDAAIPEWPASLRRVRTAYPNPAIVIPGHGTMHGDSLAATQALLAKAR
jgi:glyoxylase-like metal-dependent hydrolase (beta-lactamase superfamily II)